MSNDRPFLRTNSICPTPQAILLDFVKRNDSRNIRRLVQSNPSLLSYVYQSDFYKPILLIACTEDGIKPETVQTLIELGANLYYSSEADEEWEALHFASYRTNSKILDVIVNNLDPGKIDTLANGNNALHILIKHGKSELESEFNKCADILINAGIDINQGDDNNVSAILWAAKKGYKDIVKLILQHDNVDIDTHISRGKTARTLIEEKQLYEEKLPPVFNNNNTDITRTLFSYIRSDNQNAFINCNKGDISTNVDDNDGSNTLLQLACDKGLHKIVKHLIEQGSNPNKTSEKNRNPPIEIAGNKGYYEIFDLLMKQDDIEIPNGLIAKLLKIIDNDKYPEVKIDHEKCYELLLQKLKNKKQTVDINYPDESKNTPLHYSVRYAEPSITEELLRQGASLACRNKYGFMPVEDIEPDVLEKHLDSCIEFDIRSKKFEKEDFTITFNYRTLIPPVKQNIHPQFDVEDKKPTLNDLVPETEVISYMSKAPEFKHLLKHPVIVSFLFLKWHKIRWLFYINLAFYILYCLSLVTYILNDFANFNDDYKKKPFSKFLTNISFIFYLLTFIILLLRELFQICVSPRKYLNNFENYIEIILLYVSAEILSSSNPNDDTRKQLSSIAILLAAFELVLMVGQHPKLSTNVVMLKTVSHNFFKFLSWYCLLIFAFALSFYILFTNTSTTQEQTAGNSTTPDEDDEDFFSGPGKSLFKTIIMLTGEFDASSINFHAFPILSKVIFALFIFMIAIILLNLLNGLAVSDTQIIKNDAELVGHIARAQHIRYVESMLMGNIMPSRIIKFFQKLCCCLPCAYNHINLTKPLAKKSSLFPEFLNYELNFYPNKQGQIILPKIKKGIFSCANCTNIYLDKETIRRTLSIVQVKRDEIKVKVQENVMEKRLQSIEESLFFISTLLKNNNE